MATSQSDLVLERVIDIAPQQVFDAWTKPEHVLQWFTPKPWKTIKCDNELRAGGRFNVVMQSPEGEEYPTNGCYLEVSAPHRLVWTNAMGEGYRPLTPSGAVPHFTCILTFEPHGTGTKYTATLRHANAADAKTHDDMGFAHGWGAALDQLVEMVKA